MPYILKFMAENGNKIEEICASIPLKRNNITSRLQETMKQDNGDEAEDTMKTIKSNF